MVYTCEERQGAGGMRTVRLATKDGQSFAEVVPERGALVTRLVMGGDEVLYLDEATLIDRTKNVRGGIPVLFPFAGKLQGDSYEAEGRRFTLKQHGFARTQAWEIADRGASATEAHVTLRLRSSEETLAVYPFAFEVLLTIVLESGRLRLDTTITNTGTSPLPHALGFHPYFLVDDAQKAQAGVGTSARRAFDNRTGTIVPFTRFDLTQPEVDLHLLDHPAPRTVLRRGTRAPVALQWSEGFHTLVVWTLAGKDFVCVEPWAAPAGSFPAKGPHVAPGASETWTFTIGHAMRS